MGGGLEDRGERKLERRLLLVARRAQRWPDPQIGVDLDTVLLALHAEAVALDAKFDAATGDSPAENLTRRTLLTAVATLDNEFTDAGGHARWRIVAY